MKKSLLFMLSLAFPILVISQPCLPDGITFTSQAQIDSFQVNYPGCTKIEGDVTIWGGSINNLNGLSEIISIYGNLDIYSCGNLNSLTGLGGLDSVGGWVAIYENSFENLTGLDNLRVVNKWLATFSSTLTSLQGLESLEYVGGTLQIGSHTPSVFTPISDLSALSNLSYLGGNLDLFLIPCLPIGDFHLLNILRSRVRDMRQMPLSFYLTHPVFDLSLK